MKGRNSFLPEKRRPHANQSRKKLRKMHWGETTGFHGAPDPVRAGRSTPTHRPPRRTCLTALILRTLPLDARFVRYCSTPASQMPAARRPYRGCRFPCASVFIFPVVGHRAGVLRLHLTSSRPIGNVHVRLCESPSARGRGCAMCEKPRRRTMQPTGQAPSGSVARM